MCFVYKKCEKKSMKNWNNIWRWRPSGDPIAWSLFGNHIKLLVSKSFTLGCRFSTKIVALWEAAIIRNLRFSRRFAFKVETRTLRTITRPSPIVSKKQQYNIQGILNWFHWNLKKGKIFLLLFLLVLYFRKAARTVPTLDGYWLRDCHLPRIFVAYFSSE